MEEENMNELTELVSNVSKKMEDGGVEELEDLMSGVVLFDPNENYNDLLIHYNILVNVEIEELDLDDRYIYELKKYLNSILKHIIEHRFNNGKFNCIESGCRDCIFVRLIKSVFKSSNNKQIVKRTIKAFDYLFSTFIPESCGNEMSCDKGECVGLGVSDGEESCDNEMSCDKGECVGLGVSDGEESCDNEMSCDEGECCSVGVSDGEDECCEGVGEDG
jgi:hypothetical protein